MICRLALRRNAHGISVNVRVSPDIEQFFKMQAGNKECSAHESGRMWTIRKDDKDVPPSLWDAGLLRTVRPLGHGYSLLSGGSTLGEDNNKRANISMIRLVGASNPGGVTFKYDAVMSEDGIRSALQATERAIERFYFDFIKSVDYGLSVFKGDAIGSRRGEIARPIEDEDFGDDEPDYDDD